MTIASAVCSSFKKELLQGYHDFDANGSGGDTFKIALYTSGATLDASTTDYSTNPGGGSNTEVANGNGYTTAGNTLVNTGVGLTSTPVFTRVFPAVVYPLPLATSVFDPPPGLVE